MTQGAIAGFGGKGARRLALLAGAALSVVSCGTAFANPAAAGQVLPLVPYPASVERASGVLTLTSGTVLQVPGGDHEAKTAAQLLADRAKSERGLTFVVSENSTGKIRFVRDPAIKGAEAYRLTVTPQGATIAASGAQGLVYGAMTLDQLLGSGDGAPARVPSVVIDDARALAGAV
ncbi:glycoside hydrolase family 20 zincin-like fold domain-containing protein [Novosphingobium sp. 9]|uniref:glycoside hydrolase family 20 zincin-like fold domain-containing protein n=1 Tax=Novosphingobium sp. 9 TaxID=2025349 RepID=UPI0021B5A139|nr:glycoside hydrolase family 20 zincin-like fold domain-containing protein [Novosphingobium sp. 9]